MFLEKKGLPENGELVLCTVTKIYPTSIFVELDEYSRKVGMIHISEIAPGRIRNIRDYVEEGKKVVCKVLRVDREKGHVDLSYRQVNDNQRRNKVDEIKQEQKVEKIVEDVAKILKIDAKKLFDEIMYAINKDYDLLYLFLLDVVTGETKIENYIREQRLITELKNILEKRIKPPIVEISGELTLISKEPNGIEILKDLLKDSDDEATALIYEGGGKYKIKVTASNYKTAENIMKQKIDAIQKNASKFKAAFEFKRFETKK